MASPHPGFRPHTQVGERLGGGKLAFLELPPTKG